MSTRTQLILDAVVVGAGTAGANAAYQLANRGLSVALVDKRDLQQAGAQWHNGVLNWQFIRAGVEPPIPPERADAVPRFHLFGPTGELAFRMPDPPTVSADMTLLGQRLRGLCADRGVMMFDRTSALEPHYDRDRLVAVSLNGRRRTPGDGTPGTEGGGPPDEAERLRFEAALFVDASGRGGVLRRSSQALEPWCPMVRGDELCSASDFVFRVADRDGAARFLAHAGAQPGEGVNTVGLAGGFSTRGMTVSADLDRISVLVGCLANGRYGTGPSMLAQVIRDNPWIGEPIHGGSGVIPLRRPYARFTAPGLALVGDAACQVFPAHGSGIGMGLIAGRVLADTVAPGEGRTGGHTGDIGDESLLWRYQYSFMTEFGGDLAAFDAFRRMSTALGTKGVTSLLGAGLMTEKMTRSGLEQRLTTPDPSDLPAMAAKLARRPGLAARMLPMLARVQVLARLGGRYPAELDLNTLQRWDRSLERILGTTPN